MWYSGVRVSAWAAIEGESPMAYSVCGDTVELALGGRDGLFVDCTERGLEKLIDTTSAALRELRATEA